MQTTQEIGCPLPGFEAVRVTVNMMASFEQFDQLLASTGRKGWDEVITRVDGWPAEYEGGPQGTAAPMAWRLWLVRIGVPQACVEYVSAPN